MSKKLRIKAKMPWIAYPGSTIQQNYGEDLTHGYLLWDIKSPEVFDVKFKELPNPQPYVTIEWKGNVTDTLEEAKAYAKGSRFRIRCREHIAQKDVSSLLTALRSTWQASEVTFKNDQQVQNDVISAGDITLVKNDLRNIDLLMKMLRDFYRTTKITDLEWENMEERVKSYLSNASANDDIVRNIKWSLRRLKFDNVLAYGEGNSINFADMSGIVGVFGPNRIGKSSLVATLMYTLFNNTDRGTFKNLHIINVRKDYCYGKAVINVGGTDYIVERQSVRHENKRGQEHANTNLNVYRVEDDSRVDLCGEARVDTEKVIRMLIGSGEDFVMTSLSAQNDVNNQFISLGSAKRRQVLSRFLDLDIIDRMYELANTDLKAGKSSLKSLPEKDWDALIENCKSKIEISSHAIEDCSGQLQEAQERLRHARNELNNHGKDYVAVTEDQVQAAQSRVQFLQNEVNKAQASIETLKAERDGIATKITNIESLQKDNDLSELRKQLNAFKTLEASLSALRLAHDKELSTLKQQERSLTILDDIPCGDSFPTCKFIKDAHLVKGKIDPQRERTKSMLDKVQTAESALKEFGDEDIADRVRKVEQLNDRLSQLRLQASTKDRDMMRLESSLEQLLPAYESASARASELEQAFKNEENVEVVSIKAEAQELERLIKRLDTKKLEAATERGQMMSLIDSYQTDKARRFERLEDLKVTELIANAFSKNGIPKLIVRSQLPIINVELAKILSGIVDFTIELESDDESDALDVFINYGDSKRIIELCSGMEKMIASLAIRVALINVSSLPKSDIFIVDEGFGNLDEANVEACNRFLSSLRRFFKTIIVISHVDGVKDIVDQMIEVTKHEKDARVCYG